MKQASPLDLFATFFKIGLFTFGGGYAMIPLIEREVVETKHWMEDEDMLDMVALAESTPGPIAVNSATFVGRQIAGLPGAAAATLGVILPSFFIILVVGYLLSLVMDNRIVQDAFIGIRACVLVLVFSAMLKLFKKMQWHRDTYLVLAVSVVAVAFLGISPILVLIAAALYGLTTGSMKRGGDEV